jgi:hypothetical protein
MGIFLGFILVFASLFSVVNAKSYDFTIDYEVSKGDAGTAHTTELMNDFSITDRTLIGFSFLFEKAKQEDFKYFDFYHLLTFEIPKTSFEIGFQNSLRFYKIEDEEIKNHYEARVILSHSKNDGFYKSFAVENGYRRNFSATSPDVLKSEFKLNLRATDGIDFVSKLETYVSLNKGYNFDLTLATLYAGLKFELSKNASISLKYRRDVGGKEEDNRRGLMLSFYKSLDIF